MTPGLKLNFPKQDMSSNIFKRISDRFGSYTLDLKGLNRGEKKIQKKPSQALQNNNSV
jgi:hypothetical protein